MKKQYKALIWILLIFSLSYLYQNYKKQQTQIAPRAEVKDQEQLIVKKKTQKLPTTNVTNYLQVGN